MPSNTAAGGSYDLRYSLERADIGAFQTCAHTLSGIRKLLYLAPLVAVAVLIDMAKDTAGGAALGLANEWTRYGVTASAVIVLAILMTLFRKLALARAVRLASVSPGETRLLANSAGVRISDDAGHRAHGWDAIRSVVRGDEHVFLMTAPTQAIIVPLRAFANYDEMLRFSVVADEAAREARAPTPLARVPGNDNKKGYST
ncbi:YcxB family protein [Starkeya sp. ORNL1]|uniref:YcxB family protein n=1 Tax=Starkeya sp. ORNL1 TaxID=2709380 RepID=UPI0014633F10|nr:YcxB family protein [Starkeya sp. ORNL1]QJP15358.1 YcxB family protein [Starkeya sp. ORNL1]